MKISFSLAVLFTLFERNAKTKAKGILRRDLSSSPDYCLIKQNEVKSLGEEDDTVDCPAPDGLKIRSGGTLELGGGKNNVGGTDEGYSQSYGCDIEGELVAGDGNDVVQCKGDNLGIFVYSGASVQLGGGNNLISAEGSRDDGCRIEGELGAGDGNDVIQCKGSDTGIIVHGAVQFGGGNNDVRGTAEGYFTLGCDIFGQLGVGDGDDVVQCKSDKYGISVHSGASVQLGGGNNYFAGDTEGSIYDSYGCNIAGVLGAGDGNDVVECKGTYIGIRVNDGASVQLGGGKNNFTTADGRFGCIISGEFGAGDGNDLVQCKGELYGIYMIGGTVDLGREADVITATATSTDGVACRVTNGGQIYAHRGPDKLSCNGGLEITGSNSMVDMGNGDDLVSVEGDIDIGNAGQFLLGKGDDTVTSTGCVRGEVDLSHGHDSLFANAVQGTILGGDGHDCFHPRAKGDYVLSCGGGAPATLLQPKGSCGDENVSPLVTLDSIEQIGCEGNRILPFQSCNGLNERTGKRFTF